MYKKIQKFNEKFIKFEQEYLNLDAERVFTNEEIRFMEILRKKNNFLGIREVKKNIKMTK